MIEIDPARRLSGVPHQAVRDDLQRASEWGGLLPKPGEQPKRIGQRCKVAVAQPDYLSQREYRHSGAAHRPADIVAKKAIGRHQDGERIALLAGTERVERFRVAPRAGSHHEEDRVFDAGFGNERADPIGINDHA